MVESKIYRCLTVGESGLLSVKTDGIFVETLVDFDEDHAASLRLVSESVLRLGRSSLRIEPAPALAGKQYGREFAQQSRSR